ncbi:uncharacterized protein LOC131015576 isoform X2 [Salvia miltiorrhiza]|uniref:uncharacterized protein LOC131015576 isoform X2 n=1 Tax=Salvia miltiorrhiza TaxID=226208 RepID=UPI0025AC7D74|nr:uncharacterized protein LOC131015576 isoform X2 [Salvia miltiorrhiza]XP_057799992.1 uncharacterized protein LOC131015576 isoform X2 [Salvia miltiorrhiza]XP_057799993.1 uncharacterized protein LOC131015576 isoform X2 [Salvia miltiorrhiza]
MNNSDEKRILVMRSNGNRGMSYVTPLSPRDLSEISEESFDLPFLDPNQPIRFNSCGGLLLFIDRTDHSYLCNPTTKQVQIFPPKEASPIPNYLTYLAGACVGYDSKSDDYKILRIWDRNYCASGPCYPIRSFELYSLRDDSLKEIPSPAFMCNSGIGNITYVRGKCYWLSLPGSRVISFDYSEESFSYLPLPRKAYTLRFSLVNFYDKEDLLGIVFCGRRGASYEDPTPLPLGSEVGYYFEAWVWREGLGCWDTMFNVSLGGAVDGLEGAIYGRFLFLNGRDDQNCRLVVYDWTQKECKELGIYNYQNPIEVFCYVESTVYMRRGKPINGSPVLTYGYLGKEEDECQGIYTSPYDTLEYDSFDEACDADVDDSAANGIRVLNDIELEEEEQERRYFAVIGMDKERRYRAVMEVVTNGDMPYANTKFFLIKSDSEDDVHKSIKHNMWSCTPYGNRKLNAAYNDAQRIGCPIFLFFSVNVFGQFCGMAEMSGPVDFHRDMDLDKRSGSFPVKWHIIKDLSHLNLFRHTILHNNENMPVTDNRDIQRISFNKGLDMFRLFKGCTSKTSLLARELSPMGRENSPPWVGRGQQCMRGGL